MQSPLPKLYVKSGCPWCQEAIEYLDLHHIAYEKCVVTGNHEAMNEMVNRSGQSKAPVLDWHGKILADFGADELDTFLKKEGLI